MPLTGFRVVDLSSYYPGPLCASSLAELGADVVKVDRPGPGDPARAVAPGSHRVLNRDKRVVVADLRLPEDRAGVLELIDQADVVVESFRPGRAARLGVAESDVRPRNPRLIYCSINGSGQASDAGAHDADISARSGLLWMSGDGGTQLRWTGSVPYVDVATAAYAVQGILAALLQRERTGRGATLEIPMLAAALKVAEPRLADYLAAGSPPREKFLDRVGYGAYLTADGRHVVVACVTDAEWDRLLQLRECATIRDDDRFASADKRRAHTVAIRELLRGVFLTQTAAEWLSRLAGAGLAAAPVLAPDELALDPVVGVLETGLTGPDVRVGYPVRGLGHTDVAVVDLQAVQGLHDVTMRGEGTW